MGTVSNECTLSKRFSEIVFHSEQQRAGKLETNHNQYKPYLTAVNAVIIISSMVYSSITLSTKDIILC